MSNVKGTLYIVATPIGNLDDMTPRAIQVLQEVDLIAAEDTRHSGKLLQHFAITTQAHAYHEHNERDYAPRLVERMEQGANIALISDAGTPLVSDPGYHLVKGAREAGLAVVPVPGASALIAALSASGLPSDRFRFEGFLPSKVNARRQRLQSVQSDTATLIFYESTHRIDDSLEDMLLVFGADREVVVARELTKRFETIYSSTLSEVVDWLAADANQKKGEFVVMVRGAEEKNRQEVDADVEHVLTVLLEELPVKQASALASKITGVKKNKLYQWALSKSKQGVG